MSRVDLDAIGLDAAAMAMARYVYDKSSKQNWPGWQDPFYTKSAKAAYRNKAAAAVTAYLEAVGRHRGSVEAEANRCRVPGCIYNAGKPFAGQLACEQNWSGDPQAHRDHLRACALRQH